MSRKLKKVKVIFYVPTLRAWYYSMCHGSLMFDIQNKRFTHKVPKTSGITLESVYYIIYVN